MKIIRSSAVADVVLAQLFAIIDEDCDKTLYLESYVNGREHGYAITVDLLTDDEVKVVFSEYRRSDAIVVYVGTARDFSLQGNVPSEEVYKKAVFFAGNNILDAAVYIHNTLKLS